MTTYLPFNPVFRPNQVPWTGTVTLDGNGYTLKAWWNIYSQGWYATLTALDNTLILTKPIIGSPPLTALADLTWETGSPSVSGSVEEGRAGGTSGSTGATGSIVLELPAQSATGQAIGSAAAPLAVSVPIGGIIEFTISGTTPSGYGGVFECVVLDDFSFSYPLTDNPGTPATSPGFYSTDINLVEGYFLTSTLVWRPSAGWFEINP